MSGKLILIFVFLFFIFNSSAYETYEISDSDLEQGYTKDLHVGDRINFPVGNYQGHVSIVQIYVNSAQMGIFAHDRKHFNTPEHPDFDIFSNEQKFEMTEDNYYDLKVTLNSAVINEDGTRVASVTLQKIHDEIPEGTEIYYDCWQYYECRDGTRIKYCDYSPDSQGCGCHAISSADCPSVEDEDNNQNSDSEDDVCSTTWVPVCCEVDGGNLTVANECACEEDRDGVMLYQGDCVSQEDESDVEIFCPVNDANFCIDGKIVEREGVDVRGCPLLAKCVVTSSFGSDFEIRVTREQALEKVVERFGNLNFEIELNEFGSTDFVYIFSTQKPVKIFGFIRATEEVVVYVSIETGEIVSVDKPWWSFLASDL